ncbi:protein kiaa0556 [Plakobranchus ocellatus]|uniref:Protein kiaa0556 n=1 Tax=Plakobranchus ocellatus TaxID=259542 RepID=A0AAV4D2M7_9GAST|nr:protein kiaa0556 [Plakobranchus ocellatus]
MDPSRKRRKWTSCDLRNEMPLHVPAAKEEVPPQYEHYLHLLQERNRLMKRLRQKNKQEIDLEKKEKGFTLYLNNSYHDNKPSKSNKPHRAKTAGAADTRNQRPETNKLSNSSVGNLQGQSRDKRRHWKIASVEFTTADGQRQKIKPPEILTGRYHDDFEQHSSDDDTSGIVRSMSSLDVDDEYDSDSGQRQSVSSSSSSLNTPRKVSYLKRVAAAKREEEEIENRVTLKVEDIKKLRESLQMDKRIRQSIAMDIESDESDGERVSPIGEEIEEAISSDDERGKLDASVKPLKLFKPGETLVLEFQPLPTKSKSKTNLAAPRKKDSEPVHFKNSSKYEPKKGSNAQEPSSNSSSLKTFEHSSVAKTARPISANRKSSESKADSAAEANAVVRALQEENKKAEVFSKVSSSRPLPQPRSSKGPETDRLELTFEIMSNWGHPSLVGLTELQFFDQSGCLVPVKPSDISVTGAGSSAKNVGVLFNGKSKTTKERNMWSCKFDGRPIEFSIMLINPNPGKTFYLGSAKVWNWNNKISNLDIGARSIRIFFGRELLFSGDIDKGCGNQVFDYSNSITLSSATDKNTRKSKAETQSMASRHGLVLNLNKLNSADAKVTSSSSSPPHKDSIGKVNPGETKHTPVTSTSSSPVRSAAHYPHHQPPPSPSRGDVSPALTPSGSHHTFRSISRSSQSSASSSGSARLSRGRSQEGRLSGGMKVRGPSQDASRERQEGGAGRSETRTLNHPTVLLGRRGSAGSAGSGFSSPEASEKLGSVDLPKMPEKKRAETPKKTKRVAAKLNGRSSETENSSKSNADSFESKPPLPPTHKSDDNKPVHASTSRSAERSNPAGGGGGRPLPNPSPKSSKSEPQLASPCSLPPPAGSSTNKKSTNLSTDKNRTGNAASKTNASAEMDATNEGNKNVAKSNTPHWQAAEQKENLVEKIKTMGQAEDKRKKDIPKWLKDQGGAKNKNGREEDDLQKQLDEEFERFSQGGSERKTGKSIEEEGDILTPMKKIEKSRAKWRKKEEDLEESWGSLSFFNKSHRGRVSIDMGDDELDEYLNPTAKAPAVSNSATATTSTASVPTEPAKTSKLPIPEDGWSDEDTDDFTIPELPSGRELVINIKTTWGDHHYVGLTGVQLFSHLGEPVQIAKVWANPSDINILPEYNRDPRVVSNILDGVNRTRDDVHMWLAPFTAGNNHFVYFTFSKPCKLALMRIWNYNKSRIHSFRGAKDVVITLDGTEIFKGEIARACGGIEGGTEAFGDTILFTTDETILEAVSKNDDAFEGEMLTDDEEDVPFERPSTADAEDDTRPFTRAAGLLAPDKTKESPQRPGTSFVTNVGDVVLFKTNKLELQFTATWGDHHYLGLTGLEVVSSEGEALPVLLDMITAQPRDLRHLPGNESDDRTLDKLIDGTNVTCQDSHMWLIPYNERESHTLTVTFPQQTLVSGVRVWNYNKSPEDTYRGAKIMHVFINDRQVSPSEGFLLRKGPGVCHFDFAQEVMFSNSSKTQETSTITDSSFGGGDQNYESVVQMPRGFIFQLQLFSTWGDQYYIGLNGIEFYDSSFKKIELTETNIAAYPDSVNVLDNVSNDARTPDKLIDGCNDTNDGRHMWLAPVLPTIINRVYVIFDQPTSISMIKLWNYSKTVSRGVKDFALLVDDLLVYNGTLQSIHEGAKGILPNCSVSVPHHTVLFTENKEILHREKNAIISNQTEDQDIQLLNDKQVVSKFAKASSSKPVNQALRPKTSVTKTARR